MKRFLVMAAVLLALVASADNSYFIWEYNPDSADVMEFSLAKIKVTMAAEPEFSAYLSVGDVEGSETVLPSDFNESSYLGTKIEDKIYSNLAAYADPQYNFVLELYVWNSSAGALEYLSASDAVSYSDMLNAGYIYNNMSTAFSAYSFSVPKPIPEPTGGILLVLGIGMLALKRKRPEAYGVSND